MPREYRKFSFLNSFSRVRGAAPFCTHRPACTTLTNRSGSDQSRRLCETPKFVYVLNLGSPTHPTHTESHVPPRTFFWYCKYSEINNRFYSRDAHYCVPLGEMISGEDPRRFRRLLLNVTQFYLSSCSLECRSASLSEADFAKCPATQFSQWKYGKTVSGGLIDRKTRAKCCPFSN